MSEVIDTNRFPIFPEGIYTFKIAKPVEKRLGKTNGKPYYLWRFIVDGNESKGFTYFTVPWDCKDLFLALGFDPDKEGKFEMPDNWKTDVVGMKFTAKVEHIWLPDGSRKKEVLNFKGIENKEEENL